jgi:hypothetical protein
MALSNIFREPRREITETVVGVALITIPVVADYFAARGLQKMPGWGDIPLFLGMTFVPLALFSAVILGAFVLFQIPLLVHSIGESACDALQRRGIHLRPRNRV